MSAPPVQPAEAEKSKKPNDLHPQVLDRLDLTRRTRKNSNPVEERSGRLAWIRFLTASFRIKKDRVSCSCKISGSRKQLFFCFFFGGGCSLGEAKKPDSQEHKARKPEQTKKLSDKNTHTHTHTKKKKNKP